MKLILASNSRTRKEILDKVGLKYEVCPSNIEEHSIETDPKEYVMDLSRQKGLAVASSVSEGVILSADSIIYIADLPAIEYPHLSNMNCSFSIYQSISSSDISSK